jgi:hypothetical protein
MFTNAMLETSCMNEREPAKIAIYSVYYTKYPEQKWRRSIAKDVDCERCRFLQFSKKKYSKTAGFGKWKQANLDFV